MARYCPYYCEENIWHLAKQFNSHGHQANPMLIIFISNRLQQVALWRQRWAQAGPVVWDYHVVLATINAQHLWHIWDPDSQLNTPVLAVQYIQATFPPLPPDLADFEPRFRCIEGNEFLSNFTSDRRHMRNPNGGWLYPPPSWPPIGSSNSTHNLHQYYDVSKQFHGKVMSLKQLMKKVTTSQS